MTDKHEYIEIARKAIRKYVNDGQKIDLDGEINPELKEEAGVFVSLKKKGQLRGCIGTIQPTQDNLGREIINNAISAATRDPRFNPVRAEEIDELDISVDVMGEPEKIDNPQQLDTQKFGVIVKEGQRSGLLLPNLEGIDAIEEQIDIARRKAGIGRNEDIELYRFRVQRYE